jgi:hypothetical protein
MKTTSLGLLEVIVVRAYGDVTVSPCFAVELRILLSSIFGKKNPLGRFCYFRGSLFAREHTSQGWRGEGERIHGDMANLARMKMAIEVQLLALS